MFWTKNAEKILFKVNSLGSSDSSGSSSSYDYDYYDYADDWSYPSSSTSSDYSYDYTPAVFEPSTFEYYSYDDSDYEPYEYSYTTTSSGDDYSWMDNPLAAGNTTYDWTYDTSDYDDYTYDTSDYDDWSYDLPYDYGNIDSYNNYIDDYYNTYEPMVFEPSTFNYTTPEGDTSVYYNNLYDTPSMWENVIYDDYAGGYIEDDRNFDFQTGWGWDDNLGYVSPEQSWMTDDYDFGDEWIYDTPYNAYDNTSEYNSPDDYYAAIDAANNGYDYSEDAEDERVSNLDYGDDYNDNNINWDFFSGSVWDDNLGYIPSDTPWSAETGYEMEDYNSPDPAYDYADDWMYDSTDINAMTPDEELRHEDPYYDYADDWAYEPDDTFNTNWMTEPWDSPYWNDTTQGDDYVLGEDYNWNDGYIDPNGSWDGSTDYNWDDYILGNDYTTNDGYDWTQDDTYYSDNYWDIDDAWMTEPWDSPYWDYVGQPGPTPPPNGQPQPPPTGQPQPPPTGQPQPPPSGNGQPGPSSSFLDGIGSSLLAALLGGLGGYMIGNNGDSGNGGYTPINVAKTPGVNPNKLKALMPTLNVRGQSLANIISNSNGQ